MQPSKTYPFFRKMILEKKRGISFLFFLSLFWRIGAFIKNRLYDWRVLKAKKVESLVVSIGSIVAGGTGKTPLLLHLLSDVKKRVAVLSRGYQSKAEKKNVIAASGSGPLFSARQIGDEPFLISKKVPESFVFVGRDRALSARKAVREKLEVLILDDGFQHRRLHRDIDIVTLNAYDLFGQGHFLPRGFLRDSPKRLKEADLIVVNSFHRDVIPLIRKYSASPIVGVQKKITHFEQLDGKVARAPKKCGVFCGIANPEKFKSLLEEMGVNIVLKLFFEDHGKFGERDLKNLYRQVRKKEGECIVCTEKDAVKLDSKLPILVAVSKLLITYGQADWDLLIEKIGSINDNPKVNKETKS